MLQTAANRLYTGDTLPPVVIPAKCFFDDGPQSLIATRFQQKIKRSPFHRQHGCFHIRFRDDTDDRPMIFALPQRGQPIQIDLRMGHMKQDATRIVGRRVLLEVFRRVAQAQVATELLESQREIAAGLRVA